MPKESNIKSILIMLVLLPSFGFTVHASDTLQRELDSLLGKPKAAVLERFGTPQLDLGTRLLYLRSPSVHWSERRSPTPHRGSIVGGISARRELPAIGLDGCEIEVSLDEQADITAIHHLGPGCFEFIHGAR